MAFHMAHAPPGTGPESRNRHASGSAVCCNSV